MSFNETFVEATKTAIKTNNNELALKMIENLEEKPDQWNEYLSIGILNKNYTFTKTLIEKLGIDINIVPRMNPSLFHSEINKDISSNYSEVECPLIIQAAMGGDIEIFKYLIHKSPNSINLSGHITLSKKNKNSVISNVVGAAAYYANIPLLEFITHQFKSNLNFRSTEKKLRIRNAFSKEWTDFTPSHLAVWGEGSEEEIIQILELLNFNKSDMTLTDTYKNNILHLSCRLNKVSIVKFLLNNLNLQHLLSQINKDGQTPIAIAQEKGDTKLIYLLESYTNTEQSVEDEINKLIEETETGKKKKGQKKKKGAKGKDEIDSILLNSTDYQETFKQPVVKKKLEFPPEEIKKVGNTSSSETHSEKGKEETNPIPSSKVSNNNQSHSVDGEKRDSDNVKNYERKSYNTYKERDNYNSSYKNNNKYYYDSYNENYSYNYDRYNRYNNDSYQYSSKYTNKEKYNKETENENKNKKSSIDKGENQPQEIKRNSNPTYINSVDNQIYSKPNSVVIGLNTNKKERKSKTEEKQVKEVEINMPQPTDETAQVEKEESDYEEDFLGGSNEDAKPEQTIEENIIEKNNIQQDETVQIKDEATNADLSSNIKKEEKTPIHNCQNETSEQIPTTLLNNLTLDNKNKEMTAAYLELERKFEMERVKNKSLEQLLNASKINSANNSTNGQNNQNISDLLALANSELEEKSKTIKNLTARIEYLEGKTIHSLDEMGLNKLKDFYGSKLSTIVASLTTLKYQNDLNTSSNSCEQGQ